MRPDAIGQRCYLGRPLLVTLEAARVNADLHVLGALRVEALCDPRSSVPGTSPADAERRLQNLGGVRAARGLEKHRRMRIIVRAATIVLVLAGCAANGGVLDASWPASSTRTDGSPATNVVYYRVYYSTTDPPCPNGPSFTVDAATARRDRDQHVTLRLTNLTVGQLYYVAVAAVDSRGVSSGCSPTASARAHRP